MTDSMMANARTVAEDGDYSKFEIGPLPTGVGTTLGNALRRSLLSSLVGAAPTSAFVYGVPHEFSAIEGVKEDVSDLLLNLKATTVALEGDDSVRLVLDVRGIKDVRASDFVLPAGVTISNPDLYLCALDNESARLRMEVTVEKGVGYVTADKNKRDGQQLGTIPLDSNFSPVKKANFFVEKTRVGQDTNWDMLLVEVWTNGTLSGAEALSSAANVLTSHLQVFSTLGSAQELQPVVAAGSDSLSSRLTNVAVEELDLSVRTLNCLKANDITSLGALLALRKEELLSLRNFGQKSLTEIKEQLLSKGFASEEELTDVL